MKRDIVVVAPTKPSRKLKAKITEPTKIIWVAAIRKTTIDAQHTKLGNIDDKRKQ